jgi:hypothetical protein
LISWSCLLLQFQFGKKRWMVFFEIIKFQRAN